VAAVDKALRAVLDIPQRYPYSPRSLRDVGIGDDVEETGATFAKNTRLKAEYYAGRSGLPVLADDSGLEVHTLGGEPGVFSHC
jgi:XTP/dITP diphosphohydrolase